MIQVMNTKLFGTGGALFSALLGVGVLGMAQPPALAGADNSAPSFAKLQAVPFSQVRISDQFWKPRQDTNRLVSIPHNLEMLAKAGNIKNFELAAAGARSGYSGPVFMDSDLYKGLEAAAYSLATHPDPELDRRLDAIIGKIAAAQQADGYLNTHFQVNAPEKRWTNLRDWHELYCAGHLFEAAVAHFQATGKRNFLEVARRLADTIDATFGEGPGKRMGYSGHPEIELALVKLWRITGEPRYFQLARFFIENRGIKFFAKEHGTPLDKYDGTYWQDDVPICDHRQIQGHAVRAGYLLAGAVDVFAETGDQRLERMVRRVWRNTTQKRMYITGGIGPSAHNEGFTEDYDLPNLTAYQETCASVAMVLWNHRLALLYGDARYADLVERALYNGVLAGVSRDGTRFFYVNPLASTGNHHRSGWFGCACCPPNVARTLASLGGYAFATSDQALWINLYVQSQAEAKIGAQSLQFNLQTDYPWDGLVRLELQPAAPASFQVRLRLPAWCEKPSAAINGRPVTNPSIEKDYMVLSQTWEPGDVVELKLPMTVQRMAAHPAVKENIGQLAVQRGPLVYCLEACDQQAPLKSIFIPAQAQLAPEKVTNEIGAMVVLHGAGRIAGEQDWRHTLYQPYPQIQETPITAIPYYAWDNRQPGAMRVWMPETAPTPPAGGLAQTAQVSVSFKNSNCQPEGVNDGLCPKKSQDQSALQCHWWPRKGSEEWVQYTWKKPVTVNGSSVFWFNDTRRGGGCHLPESWKLLYLQDDDWKPVSGPSRYAIQEDGWCEVRFEPVTTTALRLVARLKPEWAAGVHEWKVGEEGE